MATHTPVTEVLDLTVEKAPRRRWLEVLDDWVTTVDHKKIGLMYIGYALFFLVVAGFEALLMRVQLAIPNNHFVSPQVFNRLFTMHGTTMVFFVGMPILFGFGNYLIPLMIGARDMAFPRLNAFSFWISAFGGVLLYFSYFGGSGLYASGKRTGYWLVCLCSAHSAGLLTGPQHGLLDAGDSAQRNRHYGYGVEHRRDNDLHALSRHEVEQDAVAGLALPGYFVHGLRYDQPAHRGADHVDA